SVDQRVDLRNRDGHVRHAKELFTQAEKGNQKTDLDWIHAVVDDLDGREIEAQHESRDRAQRSGPAKSGKYSKSDAESDAECDLLRRDALLQQVDYGPQDTPMEQGFAHATFCWNRTEALSSLFNPNS